MSTWQWLRGYTEKKSPEQVADMVLATFLRDAPPKRRIPVDVDGVAKWLGVTVRLEQPGPDEGSASLDSLVMPPLVKIRPSDALPHRRFSLAHELGHLMLHPPGLHDRNTKVPGWARSTRERDANAFGAALLMPADWVTRDILANDLDVARLASVFAVSRLAMHYRLTNLRLLA